MKLLRNNKSGFTLVELMVVVAIIGILATIAIPQYSKFQAKARQSEAKVGLSGLYTGQQSYQAEQGGYTTCLADTGFSINGQKRYYRIGFTAKNNYNLNGASSTCTSATAGHFIDSTTFAAAITLAGTSVVAANFASFTAEAKGVVNGKDNVIANQDAWTIDQDSKLNNTTPSI